MTNLEQILEIVKKKYPEAEIKEEDQYSIISKHNSIYYVSYNNKRIWPNDFDNIIELKHYLGIDIEWEDIKEYIKDKKEISYNYEDSDEVLDCTACYIGKSGAVYGANDSISNRSYWQIYNIIKNLVEN